MFFSLIHKVLMSKSLYKQLVRPLLFLLKPETIHRIAAAALRIANVVPGVKWLIQKVFTINHPALQREVFNLKFSNPVGLAAGFDKNAELFRTCAAFGFAFIEIGTVTPKPQPGNPKPRSFRLKTDRALVNRMGFNNKGLNYVKLKLQKKRPKNLVLGGNIGKNTVTSNADAVSDYLADFQGLYPLVDYIAVNVSCPNVCQLRDLQCGDGLQSILSALIEARNAFGGKPKPILLKISPDMSVAELDSMLQIAEQCGVDGYIATNTTTSRQNLVTPKAQIDAIGMGGLSGAPLAQRSTEVIRHIHRQLNGRKPIIGVGGVMSPADTLDKLDAGASLVQLFTGFIYEGPAIVKRINRALIARELEK